MFNFSFPIIVLFFLNYRTIIINNACIFYLKTLYFNFLIYDEF